MVYLHCSSIEIGMKQVADVNLKNQKYHFTKIANFFFKVFIIMTSCFSNKLHSVDENNKLYLLSETRTKILTLIFHSQKKI